MNNNEALNALRASAKSLPMGRRNQVLNRCDRIGILLKKVTSEDEHRAIKERHNAALDVVAALLAGRVLSYKNGNEFFSSQFHTIIIHARKIIVTRYPEFEFCSKWTKDEGGHPYKLYWLESK